MKMKYGELVVCIFYPIYGAIYLFRKGQKEKGDPHYFMCEIQRNYPKAKFIASGGIIL